VKSAGTSTPFGSGGNPVEPKLSSLRRTAALQRSAPASPDLERVHKQPMRRTDRPTLLGMPMPDAGNQFENGQTLATRQ
jgi:hypothetical protein